jgi:hypothetical protein
MTELGPVIISTANRSAKQVDVNFTQAPGFAPFIPAAPVHMMLVQNSTIIADFLCSAASTAYDINPDVALAVGDKLYLHKDNDIVPKMTANSMVSNTYTHAASASNSSASAYQVFDHDVNTAVTISGNTGNFILDFGAGNSKVVTGCAITVGASMTDTPNAFTINGSTDGSGYTAIYTSTAMGSRATYSL